MVNTQIDIVSYRDMLMRKGEEILRLARSANKMTKLNPRQCGSPNAVSLVHHGKEEVKSMTLTYPTLDTRVPGVPNTLPRLQESEAHLSSPTSVNTGMAPINDEDVQMTTIHAAPAPDGATLVGNDI